MKNILLLTLVILFTFSCKSDKNEFAPSNLETTVYYLIRHAEKDRSTPNEDPGLTEKGLERAKNWANILKEKKIDLVFSTEYKRTQQTAKPIASARKLENLSYDARDLYSNDFKIQTKGKSSLIVGHSNTTPVFVNTILGKQEYKQMDDKDNGKLYIVSIVNDSVSVKIEDYN